MDIYRERIRDNISASKSGGNRAVKTQDELETSVDMQASHHVITSLVAVDTSRLELQESSTTSYYILIKRVRITALYLYFIFTPS